MTARTSIEHAEIKILINKVMQYLYVCNFIGGLLVVWIVWWFNVCHLLCSFWIPLHLNQQFVIVVGYKVLCMSINYCHNFCFSGFMILMYVFETYLDWRQHSALKLPTLPKTLEGVISQEKFEKSRAYSLDKRFSSYFFVVWCLLCLCCSKQ